MPAHLTTSLKSLEINVKRSAEWQKNKEMGYIFAQYNFIKMFQNLI